MGPATSCFTSCASLSFDYFLETGSDLTDSDNCPPSPLLGWSFLMSFACVSVCLLAHRETNHAAGRTCCPWNCTLSGYVWVAGLYRFSPDASHPRGMEGWKEDGWRRVLLRPFWRIKMGLAGPGQLPLCGTGASFSAQFHFFIFWFWSFPCSFSFSLAPTALMFLLFLPPPPASLVLWGLPSFFFSF